MVEPWSIGLAASATISMTFLAVSVLLAVNLTRSGQWARNPLSVGTMAIFFTCGAGHLIHTLFLLFPGVAGAEVTSAIRHEYSEWHTWVVDGLTAAAGVSYWLLRRKFPGLVSGAAVYEDLRIRQKQALEIHDNVVQGLARAKLALDLDRASEGDQALQDTLDASRRIITELLGQKEIAPGDLRRSKGSGGEAPHGH